MVLKKVGPDEFNISRSFKDVNISFAKNAVTKDTAIVKNENAIKQAIKNLVLTRPGEKHFQPEIGSEVYTLLFEPLDDFTAETIQDEIINTINGNEDRVSLESVICEVDEERNGFQVEIRYRIVGIPLVEQISFVLQRPV
tara:strand:+ start:95 stop:514 length:420 start_codon:yes stop_codon:yes gene_type:complete